jgi:tetratricopeptide (TPR) repeat protein
MKFKIICLVLTITSAQVSFTAAAGTEHPVELQLAKTAMKTDLDLAEQHIETALEKAPQDAEVQFICGRIMGQLAENAIFSALSYAKKSLACLKKAVALQPRNTAYRKGLMSFYLGAPGIAGGDEQLALQEAIHIAQIDSLQGLLAKLSYYRKTEQTTQYQELLAQGRADYPEQAEFHYRHGLFLQENKRYADASEAFDAATQAKQDEAGIYHFNAWYQIGRTALFSEQQLDKGIQALDYYIAHAPQSDDLPEIPWAQFRLAQLHKLSGNHNMMQQHLELASHYNDKELQREIRRLQR